MILIRKSHERGHIEIDWLKAKHSFSFGSYFDPNWMGFSKLRVVNEDWIGEGMGFDTHSHRDMEIISFIIDGAMEHRDTLGNQTQIHPGEIQIMSAGTGIYHSEFNPENDRKTHSLQIWIEPERKGIEPRYEQFKFEQSPNKLIPLITPDGGKNIARIYQDASLYYLNLQGSKQYKKLDVERSYWIHVVSGEGVIAEKNVSAGDSVALREESELNLASTSELKLLLFDLP